jgi:hypothetical protein
MNALPNGLDEMWWTRHPRKTRRWIFRFQVRIHFGEYQLPCHRL